MTRLMRNLLAERATEAFVGRAEELAILRETLLPGRPAVVFVHGIGGIGKSSLLDVFSVQARAGGATVLLLDCRAIDPTESGFLREIAVATGGEITSVDDAAERLANLRGRVVIILDAYERLRFLDTWLRRAFVPAVGDDVGMIVCGRDPPYSAWLTAPGWQGLVRSVNLGPLAEDEALELLHRSGIGDDAAPRINRFARGHPLALRLAAAARTEQPELPIEDLAAQRVIGELIRIYLADVPDPVTREVLEAASLVRRSTQSLLHAMLPHLAPQDAYERLRALPFVQSGRDGLIVHDLVQEAVAAALRAADPSRRQAYRTAAWRQLSADARAASRADLWRYTLDLLYMIENPVIRESFFPDGVHRYAVEPARSEDGPAIEAMVARHEGADVSRFFLSWWRQAPQVFRSVRENDGVVVGFYAVFQPTAVPLPYVRDDPVFGRWWQHLQQSPVASDEKVLFCHLTLSRDYGEGPSPVDAACNLDLKGLYMRLRPHLRRLYCVLRDVEEYGPFLRELGFRVVPDWTVELDGIPYYSGLLDFGPASVDGWLAWLMSGELGQNEDILLDREARELVVDGQRTGLTRLEFGVLEYFSQHEGGVATRAALLESVWGYAYDGGSNVVDVVIRSLRKKLGARAPAIETITGAGYRFRKSRW